MDGLKYVKNNVSSLDKRSNVEQKRVALFSAYTYILLSKEVYEKNSEIKDLINKLNLDFKDYVFRSRTMIVARFIRILESASENEIDMYLDTIMNILFDSNETKKQQKSTSISKTISKFIRNDTNE